MKVYLKLGSDYVGQEPTQTGNPYANRVKGGSWEEVELTKHDNGRFDAKLIASNRQLSWTPRGLETRIDGTYGVWELPFATAQPDGSKLLYRTENDCIVGPVLTIEEA